MVEALTAAPTGPAKVLVTGGVGAGKSTVLAAVREVLRGGGLDVSTRLPAAQDRHAVVVIDDAHLLSAEELGRLTDLTGDPDSTVIIASEPRESDDALRTLTTAIERERPRVALGPLGAAEVSRLLVDPSGHPPRPTW